MTNLRLPEQEKSGKKIFWIGVILAVGLGLAIREAFDPVRLTRWTQRALKNAAVDTAIQYRQVGLSLSHSGMPSLAVEVSGLVIRSKSPCAFVREIVADKLYLPLSVWSLAQKQLRVGKARIEGGRISLQPEDARCGSVTTQAAMSPARDEHVEQKWLQALSEQLARLRKNWPVEAIYLSNVHLVWVQSERTAEVQLPYFQVRQIHGDGPLRWDGVAHMPEWLGIRGLPRVHLEGEWDDKSVMSKVRGHWKEGSLAFDIRLENQHNETATLSATVDVNHLPLAQVNQVLSRFRQKDLGNDLRPVVWFSCSGKLESAINRISGAELGFNDCSVHGDLGQIQVRGLKFKNPLHPVMGEPLALRFEHTPMAGLKEIMGWPMPFAGLGPNLGWIEGDVQIDSGARKISGRGVWHQWNWSGVVAGVPQTFNLESAQFDFETLGENGQLVLQGWKPELGAKLKIQKDRGSIRAVITDDKGNEKKYSVQGWDTQKPRIDILKARIREAEASRQPASALAEREPWPVMHWLAPDWLMERKKN
jgi:hypothetical protein